MDLRNRVILGTAGWVHLQYEKNPDKGHQEAFLGNFLESYKLLDLPLKQLCCGIAEFQDGCAGCQLCTIRIQILMHGGCWGGEYRDNGKLPDRDLPFEEVPDRRTGM